MNICLDISAAIQQEAGIGRYTTRLAEHLLKLDVENSYSFFHNAAGRAAVPAFAQGRPIQAVRLRNKPWRFWLILAHRLNVSMDRRFAGVDLFHATDVLFPPLKRVKVVATVHDLSFLLFPSFHTRLNRLNLRLMTPQMMRRADLVIAVSENTKRDLERILKVPGGKIRVVHEGVEDRFKPAARDQARDHIANRYGIRERFILHTGTLEPRKNIATLINAFAVLKSSKRLPHKLVVAGKKGWFYEHLFALVKEKGLDREVIFSGFVPDEDLPLLYSAADLFVYPSFYEGFGLPPLEAMACGTPVICSDVSSLPEVVGDAGIRIDPHDLHDLIEALARALSDEALRRRMSAEGLERARRFTWAITAAETVKVYQECLLPCRHAPKTCYTDRAAGKARHEGK